MIARVRRLQASWPGLLLVLLVWAAYWPGRSGGYVFDDFPNIVDNIDLHVTTLDWHAWSAAIFSFGAGSLHRPFAMLSFAANYFFTGIDPVPMKLTNIAIHAANALLVLGLLRTLLAMALPALGRQRREWAARFAAAAWALHPINLLAVLFVVQRMESLSHTFVFAGLWLYLLGRQRQLQGRNGWPLIGLGVLGGTALGALSKESAVLLPLYAACIELCVLHFRSPAALPSDTPAAAANAPHSVILSAAKDLLPSSNPPAQKSRSFPPPSRGLKAAPPRTTNPVASRVRGQPSGARDRRLLAGYLLVLVIPALLAVAWLLPASLAPGAYATRDFNLGERLLTEGRVVMDYLRWTLFPSLRQLSLYHDDFQVSRGLLTPWTTLPALLGIAGLLAFAAWVRPRRPLVALGLLWFAGAQLLTAGFIPLELVYEHRNYFASLGICLAVADLLLLAPGSGSARRIGGLLAVLWLLALTVTTHLRAREWSDPYRFAATEAAKHPQSPRATYAHALLLTVATGHDPGSPLLGRAEAALEHARATPGSGILPIGALLMLAASTGQPTHDAWWDDMQARLRAHPLGVQETGAIAGLTRCMREGRCRFAPERIADTFQAARSHGPNAEIDNIQADYVLNVLHQPRAALALWRRAVALDPRQAQYRINLIKLLIAMDRVPEARDQIGRLRRLGRFGKNDAAAAELESGLPPTPQAAVRK